MTTTPTFKTGDRVKVSDNPTTEDGGYVSASVAGSIGVVAADPDSSGDIQVDVERDSDGDALTQWIAPRHLTLVTFQTGDKVRIGNHAATSAGGFVSPRAFGCEALVDGQLGDGRDVRVKGTGTDGLRFSQYIGIEHLTLVEDEATTEPEPRAFQPGDKVRIGESPRASEAWGASIERHAGKVGAVEDAADEDGDVYVRFEDGGFTYVLPEHLTLVEDCACSDDTETVEAELVPDLTVADFEAAFALNEALKPGSTRPVMAIVEAFAAHRRASR